jgi:5,10-methylene-tetrahydrofolate dehydrogenase/methenyl tetrahydrofolate cyclohydrolase
VAKYVLKDASITVAGVDLSDHFTSVTIDTSTEDVDVTGFSSASYREFATGFKDATISGDVLQDHAVGEVDATLWPLGPGNVGGTTFAVVVKPTSAAVGTTNPSYTLPQAALFEYSPIAGGLGDASSTSVTFRNSGTAGIVRAVA